MQSLHLVLGWFGCRRSRRRVEEPPLEFFVEAPLNWPLHLEWSRIATLKEIC